MALMPPDLPGVAGPGAIPPALSLFLCGDVMLGRGIDQVLPHPSDPTLHEPWVKNAKDYVGLAKQAHGLIPTPVDYAYIWGAALPELERRAPDLRIVNLETSVTRSNDWWKGKGIHYRMHPANIPGLTVAGIDACSLANNHVLDWGHEGLLETLSVLHNAGIATAGAGRNSREAARPAVLSSPGKGRVLLFAYGAPTSGIPPDWAVSVQISGIQRLPDLSETTARSVSAAIQSFRHPGDRVILSLHWGTNWGYAIDPDQRRFARILVDTGMVDLVHGHSSHHALGMEVYRGKLILFGCGDFINDYEGIGGHEAYRGDLALMFFVQLGPTEKGLAGVEMVPLRMRKFQLQPASRADAHCLAAMLNREGELFNTGVDLEPDNRLVLRW